MPKVKFTAATKARAVLEVIREQKTANEIAKKYGVHPTQLSAWKSHVLSSLPTFFDKSPGESTHKQQALIDELHRQIGEFQVQLTFLKKRL
jgi:transposase-like protein